MAYQNNPDRIDNRNRNYLLPLAILAVAVILGFMFLLPDNEADDLASTAPAAGSIENNDVNNNQAPAP